MTEDRISGLKTGLRSRDFDTTDAQCDKLVEVSVRLEGVGEGSFRVVDVVGTSAIRVFIYVVVRFE